jgi:hypothetical protein
MKFRKTLLAVSFTLVCGFQSVARAGQDTTDFINQANSDFQSVANFMNVPFVNSMGFFTSLGWNLPPGVYDLISVTGPHFELSFGAGADFIHLPNLNNLTGLSVVSATQNLSLPSGFPLPFPVVTARIGLFSGCDAGVRVSYIPSVTEGSVGGGFTGWGLDLRYKLCDGAALPTVTLSTSFDTMTGNITVNTGDISQSGISYTDPGSGTTYTNATLSGSSNYTLNWTTRSVGAMLIVGKNLVVVSPFAGIGFQRNSGTITSSLSGSFTADLGGSEPATDFTPSAVASGAPVVLEPKCVLGLNFGTGLGWQWSAVGETNGSDIAAILNLSCLL